MSIWIKICGNTSLEDALLAAEAGADALGFVFAPSPRRVTAEQVAAIVPRLPVAVEKIGVFVDATLEEIVSTVEACGLTGVQLHFDANPELPAMLHERLGPEVRILCVIHFDTDNAGQCAVQMDEHTRNPHVDAVLVESRTSVAAGGTGVTFDWAAARKAIFENTNARKRLIVAGGLTPANVAEAIVALRPWGVDVASGVEAAPGRKDAAKVREFVRRARENNRLIDVNVQAVKSVRADCPDFMQCTLTGALSLIAGKSIRVPKRAYPGSHPSKLSRLLQVGNGVWELILSAGRQRTLVSGEKLAYLGGDIEYFQGNILKSFWHFSSLRQPCFVVSGADPAESIAAVTGCDAVPAPRLYLSNHCAVVILANRNGVAAVLHYAHCDKAIAELGHQAEGLGIAASDPQIGHLIPRMLTHTNLANGTAVLAHTRIPAEPYEFSWRRVDAAMELWLSRKLTGEDAGRAWVSQRLAQVCEFYPRFQDLFLPALNALLKWNESTRIRGGITHGDFWLGNVLFKGDTVTGIIDWEWAQREGFLQVDVLHMLLMSCAVENDCHIAHYLRQLWADEIEDTALQERISRLCLQFDADKDDLKFVALLLWFSLLWQKAMRCGMPSELWLDNMISQTAPVITKWLMRCTKTGGMLAASP
jgi:phosphoribosylanthranilate isomerase